MVANVVGTGSPLADERALKLVEMPLVAVKDQTGNPAPLGLCAFGLTTVLLNMHNAGWFPIDAMIVAMGIFYGGIAQIFAGVMEWRKNNTFATTAFISFGFFWLALCAIVTFPRLGISAAPGSLGMAAFLGMWGLFAFILMIGSFRTNVALAVTFVLLVILFALLVIRDLTGNLALNTFLGYEGIACGLLAIYTGLAQVINEMYGRVVMPIFPIKK